MCFSPLHSLFVALDAHILLSYLSGHPFQFIPCSFKLFKSFVIYLFPAVLGLHCHWDFSLVGAGPTLLPFVVFSLRQLLWLQRTGSRQKQ